MWIFSKSRPHRKKTVLYNQTVQAVKAQWVNLLINYWKAAILSTAFSGPVNSSEQQVNIFWSQLHLSKWKTAEISFFKDSILFIWKADLQRGNETQRDLPNSGSFPKWPQQPDLGGAKAGARSQELLSSFPRTWFILSCFPGPLAQDWCPYSMPALQGEALTPRNFFITPTITITAQVIIWYCYLTQQDFIVTPQLSPD